MFVRANTHTDTRTQCNRGGNVSGNRTEEEKKGEREGLDNTCFTTCKGRVELCCCCCFFFLRFIFHHFFFVPLRLQVHKTASALQECSVAQCSLTPRGESARALKCEESASRTPRASANLRKDSGKAVFEILLIYFF